MNPALSALLIGLMLILPLSSLIARRLPFGSVLRMLLLWIAIFALVTIAILAWQSLTRGDVEEPAPLVKDVAALGMTPHAATTPGLPSIPLKLT